MFESDKMPESTVPPAHPAFSSPPVGSAPERPANTIYMTPELWSQTQAELNDLRGLKSSVQAQLDTAEQARLKAMAEAGRHEQALNDQRKSWETKHADALTERAKLEQRWLGEKNNAVLADALAGRAFVGKDPARTAAQVRRLLADEIETTLDANGNPYSRDRTTLRPAAEYLRERLESDDYSAFFAPRTGGGSGTDGTQSQANGQQIDPTSAHMAAFRKRMEDMRNGTL